MKKISLLFTALICLLLHATAYAAADAGMFDADARLTVTGTAPSRTADICVSVLDNNFTLQDADSVIDGAVVYTNQVKPKKDGTFSLRINLRNCPTGEYRIRVYQKGEELLDEVRPYAGAEDNRAAIEGLNQAAASGAAAVGEYIKQNRIRLQFVSPFDDMINSASAAAMITAAAPFDTNDKLSCADFYRRAAVAAAVADGKVNDLMNYSSMIRPMNEEPMKKVLSAEYVTAAAKSETAAFLRGLAPFNTLDAFDAAVADALILSVTKNPTGAGDVKTIISALRPNYDTKLLTAEVCRKVAYNAYSDFSKLDEAVKKAGSSEGGATGGKAPSVSSGSGAPVHKTDTVDYANTGGGKGNVTDGFSDMGNFAWAENAVNKLLSEGIVSGDGSGYFRPADNITREEFVKMLVPAFNITSENQAEMTFDDVVGGEWYYPYLQTAYRSGIVSGISGNIFGVGTPVSRQDAAVLISRAMKLTGEEVTDTQTFTDEAEISEYALKSVKLLRQRRIISGYEDGTFRPHGTITRAEAAKMLYEGLTGGTEYNSVSPVSNTSTNEQADDFAFGLLKAIGIFGDDISYQGKLNRTVSRGEFAVYLARMLNSENTAQNGTDVFSDVSPENDLGRTLTVLLDRGIVKADESRLFRPNDAATVSEMAQMLFNCFNSTQVEAAAQRYGDNYLSAAMQFGMLKGVSNYDAATFGDCVVMMYNTLHCEYTKDYTQEKSTLLKDIYDIEYIKGRVSANCFTEISGSRTNDMQIIGIDGENYTCDDEMLHELLGYRLIVYYTEEEDRRRIVFYRSDDKTTVTRIDAEDIEKYSDFTLSYRNGKRTSRIKLSRDTAIIYNGMVAQTDYDKVFDINTGFVTIISSGDTDTVIIEAYDILRITGIDVSGKKVYAERVEDGSVTELDLNEDSGKWVFFKNHPYGKNVNETMLLADDILCVSRSLDGNYIRAWRCGQTVTGNVEAVSDDEDKRYVTIDGETYKAARSYKDKIIVGERASFVLDIAGNIAAMGKRTQDDRILGYVYRLTDTREGDGDDIYIKVYNVKRQHEMLPLAEKVRLDGEQRTRDYVKQTLCSGKNSQLARQPVFYRKNADGEVTELDLAAYGAQNRERDNTLEKLLPAGSYSWLFTMKSFERKYVLSSKSYYMRVPPESVEDPDERLFGVQEFSNVTWWNNNSNKSILGLYRYDDSTPFADLVVVSSSDNAALSNSTEVTMVTGVYEQWVGDDDGEALLTLHGYRRGVEVKAYFDEGVYKNDIEEGDLIRFATNSAGRIGVYEKIYDQSEDTVLWSMTGTADEYTSNATPSAGLRYTFGYAHSLYNALYTDGLNSVISTGRNPDVPEDTWQINSNNSASTRYIVYDPERSKGTRVYMAGLDEIVAWENCRNAEDTTKVFVHTRQGYLVALFIYK